MQKMQKVKIFWLAVEFIQQWILKFYAVFLSVTVCSGDMQWNQIQILCFPMYGAAFAFFALINEKNY